MAQDVLNGLTRIPYDRLPLLLQDELRAKVERLGYLGEFFQVCAHQAEALYHFNRFTELLKTALPVNLVELLALTISSWSGNAYERVQHERLALKNGLSADWVRDVIRLDPDRATHLREDEQQVQRLALTMAESQGREADAAKVLALLGQEKTVAVLMTVGRYLAHSAISNTLDLAPPVSSPLEENA